MPYRNGVIVTRYCGSIYERLLFFCSRKSVPSINIAIARDVRGSRKNCLWLLRYLYNYGDGAFFMRSRLVRVQVRLLVVYSYYWLASWMPLAPWESRPWSVSPSAIAGVLFIHFFLPWSTLSRSDLWGFTKLYQAWKKFMAWVCRPKILLQFMLLRTNRANEFEFVRFSRSIYAVLIFPPESTPSNFIISFGSP